MNRRPAARFSVLGFVVGAILALILYAVATALVSFNHSTLVFGLLAVLLWVALSLGYGGI